MPRRYPSWHLAGSLAFAASLHAALPDSAAGEPVVRAITVPGYTLVGTTALTADSFLAFRRPLVRVFGEDFPPEGICAPAGNDTELALVRRVDAAEPEVTPIPLPSPGTGILRLSPTRALVGTSGPDATYATADDGVILVDDLGGENRVVPIAGAWTGPPLFTGARWADDAAVLVGAQSATVLSEIGHGNTVTPILHPVEHPTALDSTHFLMTSPDGQGHVLERSTSELETKSFQLLDPYYSYLVPLPPSRAIDVPFDTIDPGHLGLLDDLLSAPVQRTLTIPAPAWGEPTRLGANRLLVRSQGPGETPGLVDDQVFLIDHLDSPEPSVTTFSVPSSGSLYIPPVVLGPDLVAILSGSAPFGMDSLLVLSDLGTSNRATNIFLGAMEVSGQPVRLGPRRLAIAAARLGAVGPQLITISDVGGRNRVTSIPVPFVNWAPSSLHNSTSILYALEPGTLLAGVHDADRAMLLFFEGLGQRIQPEPTVLPFDPRSGLIFLGNGNALAKADVYEESESCTASRQVLTDLPGGIVLRARRVHVRVEAGAPTELRVSARLVLPRPDLFAGRELTVRVGTLTQAIPAAEIIPTATGYRYRDRRGLRGWLRRLDYDADAGKLVIDGGSPPVAPASIDPDNVVLSLESSEIYAAQSLAAEMRGRHLRYRAR